jgi:hypothetical protein
MGGQACVLYGAAEFSRDTDLVVLATTENLARLIAAMQDLRADVIAVPPFDKDYLDRGHAVHFRCQHPDVRGMRVDVMSRLRGVRDFDELWNDRTTVTLTDPDAELDVLGLQDLVAAKKTQRDKDWPMISRLVDTSYFQHCDAPPPALTEFWIREMRTAELLLRVCRAHPDVARRVVPRRPLVARVLQEDATATEIERLCREEEQLEREADRAYWEPLRRELEQLRRGRLPDR